MHRRDPLARYLPVAYFGIALVLVVSLIPTALRPPPQQPPSSAELSPDAPPDDEAPVLSELSRARSRTAGAGRDGAGPEPADGGAERPSVVPPRSRRCFGNPARQTEVIYSAPCAPFWSGDNGGATWKGVSRNEVRVGVQIALGQPDYAGPIRTEPYDGECSACRTLRVLQAWFNERYELWGRTLRLYSVRKPGDSTTDSRNAAVTSVDEYDLFAGMYEFPQYGEEVARRERLFFGNGFSRAMYLDHAPYWWSWLTDLDAEDELGAELICKQLWGRPAAFAGDPTLQSTTRAFGVLANREANRGFFSARFASAMDRECGASPKATIDFNGLANVSETSTAVSRMRSEGITTIVLLADVGGAVQLMAEADAQAWYPEWMLVYSTTCLDCNPIARLLPQAQMAHAFGVTAWETPRPRNETDCYRAYHDLDPTGEPDSSTCFLAFLQLVQIANGIQQAGPALTPAAFAKGLHGMGYRFAEKPVWAIGGGYSSGDPTWMDNVGVVWWEPTAITPEDGLNGAFRWIHDAKRYRRGEIPREDPVLFRDGITQPPPSERAT